VLVVIYNPEIFEAVYLLNAGSRAESEVEIVVPANYSGSTVHCYLSFMALGAALNGQTRNAIATSSYAGSVMVA